MKKVVGFRRVMLS